MPKYIVYNGMIPLATCNTRADAEEMTYAYIEEKAYITYLQWLSDGGDTIENYFNGWRSFYRNNPRGYSFRVYLLAVEDTFEIVEVKENDYAYSWSV